MVCITKIKIHGIKSHLDSEFNCDEYLVFVGENNCGKSNIFFAIRWFFGDVKLSEKDLHIKLKDDPFIEMEFKFEDASEVPDKLGGKVSDNKIKITAKIEKEKIEEKSQISKYFLDDEEIKRFKPESLIDFVYIPSIKKVDEEAKMTSKAAINKLATKFIIERLENENPKRNKFKKIQRAIEELNEYLNVGETSAFNRLKKEIYKYMLQYSDVDIKFKFNPPSVKDFVSQTLEITTEIKCEDDDYEKIKEVKLTDQGMGFQRSLIFSLLSNISELKEVRTPTLYLIEEPELFLHPNHQLQFRDMLKNLYSEKMNQVFVTTHSPYFVSNIKNYSQIKRVIIENNTSKIFEITKEEISSIIETNAEIMAKAKKECNPSIDIDDEKRRIKEEDEIRYFLWINPMRANMFLTNKVLLVEGSTELALFTHIFEDKYKYFDGKNVFDISILDTVGKYHFYKFARLLKKLGINVWIMFDKDCDECRSGIHHGILNKEIRKLKDDEIIVDFLEIEKNIEDFLGFKKDVYKPDISLYYNLCRADEVNKENLEKIIQFVKSILDK